MSVFLLLPLAVEPQDALKEKVEVVNIEVPVRVFRDGVPVDGLGEEDFRLSEDKEPQTLNGFCPQEENDSAISTFLEHCPAFFPGILSWCFVFSIGKRRTLFI